MKKTLTTALVTAICIAFGTNALAVGGELSFKLINDTGKAITSIQIKHGDKWGNDVLKDGVLANGDSTKIITKDRSGCQFDIRVTYKGESKGWVIPKANLCDIASITLHIRDGKLTFNAQK
ncbi:MAG: hypothetical protein HY017_09470 [Betaproteobacteria bacterium]|nr:hypothetical protein [Betaproteobacteria bacterium]